VFAKESVLAAAFQAFRVRPDHKRRAVRWPSRAGREWAHGRQVARKELKELIDFSQFFGGRWSSV
jgi:hypothetical protein